MNIDELRKRLEDISSGKYGQAAAAEGQSYSRFTPDEVKKIIEIEQHAKRVLDTALPTLPSVLVDELGNKAIPIAEIMKKVGRTNDPEAKRAVQQKLPDDGGAFVTAAINCLLAEALSTNAIDKARRDMHDMIEEIRSGKEAIRKIAADAALSTEAQLFDSHALGHSKAAVRWLVVGIGFFLAAFGLALIAYFYPEQFVESSIPVIISKVVLVSFLLTASFWCARNYRINRHLQVVNEHRSSAVKTFRVFLEGAKKEDAKDLILVEAVKAVYSYRSTGLSSKQEGPEHPVVNVLTALRPG